MKARFGEQRLIRREAGIRWMYRLIGIADPSHFLHSRYFQQALDGLADFDPRQILDAGCGAGDYSFYLSRRYPDAQVLGLDIDNTLIEHNREMAKRLGLTNVRFETSDLARLHAPASFDFLVSIDVLEHIAEQKQALQNLASALRPGGFAFLHIPTVRPKPVPFSRWLKDFHAWSEEEHVAESRTAEEFWRLVQEARLEIRQQGRTFGYFTGELANSLFNLRYANTAVNRVVQAGFAPLCRVLALADSLGLESTRYAVMVVAGKPGPGA